VCSNAFSYPAISTPAKIVEQKPSPVYTSADRRPLIAASSTPFDKIPCFSPLRSYGVEKVIIVSDDDPEIIEKLNKSLQGNMQEHTERVQKTRDSVEEKLKRKVKRKRRRRSQRSSQSNSQSQHTQDELIPDEYPVSVFTTEKSEETGRTPSNTTIPRQQQNLALEDSVSTDCLQQSCSFGAIDDKSFDVADDKSDPEVTFHAHGDPILEHLLTPGRTRRRLSENVSKENRSTVPLKKISAKRNLCVEENSPSGLLDDPKVTFHAHGDPLLEHLLSSGRCTTKRRKQSASGSEADSKSTVIPLKNSSTKRNQYVEETSPSSTECHDKAKYVMSHVLEILRSPNKHKGRQRKTSKKRQVSDTVTLGERLKNIQSGRKLDLATSTNQQRTMSETTANIFHQREKNNDVISNCETTKGEAIRISNDESELLKSFIEENFSDGSELNNQQEPKSEPCFLGYKNAETGEAEYCDVENCSKETHEIERTPRKPSNVVLFSDDDDDDESHSLRPQLKDIPQNTIQVDELQHVDDISVTIMKHGSTPKRGRKKSSTSTNDVELSPAMTNPQHTPKRSKSKNNSISSPSSNLRTRSSGECNGTDIEQRTTQRKRLATTPTSDRSRKRSRTVSHETNLTSTTVSTSFRLGPVSEENHEDDVFYNDVSLRNPLQELQQVPVIVEDTHEQTVVVIDKQIVGSSQLYDRIKQNRRKASISASQSSSRSTSPCMIKKLQLEKRSSKQTAPSSQSTSEVEVLLPRKSPRKKNPVAPTTNLRTSPRKSGEWERSNVSDMKLKLTKKKKKKSPFQNPKKSPSKSIEILKDFEMDFETLNSSLEQNLNSKRRNGKRKCKPQGHGTYAEFDSGPESTKSTTRKQSSRKATRKSTKSSQKEPYDDELSQSGPDMIVENSKKPSQIRASRKCKQAEKSFYTECDNVPDYDDDFYDLVQRKYRQPKR